ncbi:hypothetical protein PM082_010381 [Marasmius tenuissimus]|nr:hypothetical protein PM082_010381 [Marasmius tenuissimus]
MTLYDNCFHDHILIVVWTSDLLAEALSRNMAHTSFPGGLGLCSLAPLEVSSRATHSGKDPPVGEPKDILSCPNRL